jgi:hypothetical protein
VANREEGNWCVLEQVFKSFETLYILCVYIFDRSLKKKEKKERIMAIMENR